LVQAVLLLCGCRVCVYLIVYGWLYYGVVSEQIADMHDEWPPKRIATHGHVVNYVS
jgi:hypothetical protein